MKKRKVTITLYRWAGKALRRKIESECPECDTSLKTLREVLASEFPEAPVELIVENWLDHFWRCLLKGAWHAPIIYVDRRLFSQGVVPDRDRFAAVVRRRLSRIAPVCPFCGRLISGDRYSLHRRSETRGRVLRFIREGHPQWISSDGLCRQCLRHFDQRRRSGDLLA